MAVMLPLTTIPSRNRRLVLILSSCLLSIIFVLILVFLSTSHHHSGLASFVPKLSDTRLGDHLPLDLLDPVTDPKSTKKGPSLGSRVGRWQFDTKRDARNYGLSERQCNGAFPDYYREIERAVTWRKEEKLPNIEEHQMDISWRNGEIIRLMIYDRQVCIGKLLVLHYESANVVIALCCRPQMGRSWLRCPSRPRSPPPNTSRYRCI